MNESEQKHGNSESDLFWLAFRYVEGELAPEDAAQFELRLENEQAAREAVAEAAKLGLAVCLSADSADNRRMTESAMAESAMAISPLPSPDMSHLQPAKLSPASRDWSSSQIGSSRAIWFAAGTAACIALALTTYWLERRSDSLPDAPNSSPIAQLNARQADAQLADAWAAARWRIDEDDALFDAGGPPPEAEYALLPEDLIGELFAVDADETAVDADWEAADGELIISDWLFEAISAERAAASKSGHQEG
ncbi:MAG TPA: hypothetical protein VHC19_14715 [Pirellulales bacterium]|nr:hypothetical protein [Pirellulales bacterium]